MRPRLYPHYCDNQPAVQPAGRGEEDFGFSSVRGVVWVLLSILALLAGLLTVRARHRELIATAASSAPAPAVYKAAF